MLMYLLSFVLDDPKKVPAKYKQMINKEKYINVIKQIVIGPFSTLNGSKKVTCNLKTFQNLGYGNNRGEK